jgi:DNA-binding CsgD family transcriptional regulator/tetratricopeptide (TPR) repeat protein
MMGSVTSASSLSPLIGRDPDLARVLNAMGVGGRPQSVAHLIGGDAGVGKTRFLSALAERARQDGWRALTGHCLDFGDSALPYLPFSEALGRLAATDPAALDPILEQIPVLASLLPVRRTLAGSEGRPVESLDRGVLFDGVHAGLDALAESGPVLFVVEDVHWADRSTRDLLSLLFARPFRGPVVVIASYRSDDLHRRHPLRPTLAEWGRLPAVRRLQLEPLNNQSVRELVLHLDPGSAQDGRVRAIVSRAEGNPFFAEELTLAGGRAGLPSSLAELLLVRLDRLDPGAAKVVRTAACAGRRVSHQLLAAVLDGKAAEIDDALRSAVESNVLVPTGAEAYGFRHALLSEAVYDDLLPGERVRIHAGYVQALVSGAAEGTAAELARHARLANDLPTALRASVVAGDEAMSVGGPDEAARHFETALELLDSVGAIDDGPDPVSLVVRASDALAASGQALRAVALLQHSLENAPADLVATERARLLSALAHSSMLADTPINPVEHSAAALALIEDEASALRAKVVAVHARGLMSLGREDEAIRHANEAVRLADLLDLPRVHADASTTLVTLAERAQDPDLTTTTLIEIDREAARVGDLTGRMRALFMMGILAAERGDLVAAQKSYAKTQAVAEESGRPWAPYGFDARFMRALLGYAAGEWELALTLTDLSGTMPPPPADALLLSIRSAVLAVKGETAAARELFDRIRSQWERDALIAITAGAPAIEAAAGRGDLEAAWSLHEEIVTTVSAMWQELFAARIRLGAVLLGVVNDRIVDRDREKWVKRIEEMLRMTDAVRARIEGGRSPSGPEGRGWAARLDAEAARFRGESEDVQRALWEQAIAGFDEAGFKFEASRSRVRSGIRDEVAIGRRSLERMGAVTVRVAAPAADAPESLTPRETEIIALVAKGLSNGEIGRALYISTKTVSVHVSNILAKLGVASRTEAAAVFHRS